MTQPTTPQRLSVYPFHLCQTQDGTTFFKVRTHTDDTYGCGEYVGHIELDRDTVERMAVALVQYLAHTPKAVPS